MKENMENVAYTKEYKDRIEYFHNELFKPDYLRDERLIEIDKDISALIRDYSTKSYNEKYEKYTLVPSLLASEGTIYKNGLEIYSYRSIDDGGDPTTFIHQNGNKYLVFHKDLYGYSVLDLMTMQVFDYFPAESFPEGETFIWCDIHYNPQNNIMAVGGCFWAVPYSVILVDFTNPMKDCLQIDIDELIASKLNNDCHIEFSTWDGTDLILEKGTGSDEESKERIVLSSEEYMELFRKEKEKFL